MVLCGRALVTTSSPRKGVWDDCQLWAPWIFEWSEGDASFVLLENFLPDTVFERRTIALGVLRFQAQPTQEVDLQGGSAEIRWMSRAEYVEPTQEATYEACLKSWEDSAYAPDPVTKIKTASDMKRKLKSWCGHITDSERAWKFLHVTLRYPKGLLEPSRAKELLGKPVSNSDLAPEDQHAEMLNFRGDFAWMEDAVDGWAVLVAMYKTCIQEKMTRIRREFDFSVFTFQPS